MAGLTLYGHRGWGSVIVEAQLAWYGMPITFVDVGNVYADDVARHRLAAINPLAQVPVLVLEDGAVMTESAAISLSLAERTQRWDLIPAPGSPDRDPFLRWLIFLVANVYPNFSYNDYVVRRVADTAAQAGFRRCITAYMETLLEIMEQAASTPWFLGDRFSVIDIYVCTLSHWSRPGPTWLADRAPRLTAIAEATWRQPTLSPVWQRNYPQSHIA